MHPPYYLTTILYREIIIFILFVLFFFFSYKLSLNLSTFIIYSYDISKSHLIIAELAPLPSDLNLFRMIGLQHFL